jgi:uncharacterized repeat protein (TIGR01451 family)
MPTTLSRGLAHGTRQAVRTGRAGILPLSLLCMLAVSTAHSQQPDAEPLARAYLLDNAKNLDLDRTDLQQLLLLDRHLSGPTGVEHIYFQQHVNGVPLKSAIVSIGVRNGTVVYAASRATPRLTQRVPGLTPVLTDQAAIGIAATTLELGEVIGSLESERRRFLGSPELTPRLYFLSDDYPSEDISARLVLVRLCDGNVIPGDGSVTPGPSNFAPGDGSAIPGDGSVVPCDGSVRLAWDVRIYTPDGAHLWEVGVDALSGDILSIRDLVENDHWGHEHDASLAPLAAYAQQPSILEEGILGAGASWASSVGVAASGSSYRVFASPIETPSHGGRSLVINPADPVASPWGWHDDGTTTYTITRGNNVHAYLDRNNTNSPSAGSEPDGGASLVFDFPLDLNADPVDSGHAAVANLFYWANIFHDVTYHYGFTEAAGNYQFDNRGLGGIGGDHIRMEGQDGSGTNNANFSPSKDGDVSRVQMYLWTQTDPRRDGDLDAGIIIHEYAHALPYRLTGGPNVMCRAGAERMDEGWADYFALLLTDQNVEARGLATYVLGEPTTGKGLRPARYTRDMTENPYTYADVASLATPHGVGFLWATMLWDMTRDFVDLYGWNPNLYDGWSAPLRGNTFAKQLVMEGLKLQVCEPGFVDGRDAILAAEQTLTGGENSCTIWRAFARRGLGLSANQGSSNSKTDGTAAFDLPPACSFQAEKEANPSPAFALGQVDYRLTLENTTGSPLTAIVVEDTLPPDVAYVPGSASDGGDLVGDKLVWPAFDLAVDAVATRTYRVQVLSAQGGLVLLDDDVESGTDPWTTETAEGSATWSVSSADAYSPTNAWFAPNPSSVSDFSLITAAPLAVPTGSTLSFWHRHAFESAGATGFDGGVVEISIDGGAIWEDLGPAMTQNGYNRTLSTNWGNPLGGRQAFSGSSNGWIQTVVDLDAYAGESALVRFRVGSDASVGAAGWLVDDIRAGRMADLVNTACVSLQGAPAGCTTLRTPLLSVPVIEVAEEPIVLWPPDHKYRPVAVADFVTSVSSENDPDISIADVVITHVTSDEPENAGTADGNTFNDMVIAGECASVLLRAERNASLNGRVYRIHVAVTDAVGATGVASFPVHVPRSQGAGVVAIEDEAIYLVEGECALPLAAGDISPSPAGDPAGTEASAPEVFALTSVYPNPFENSATITYQLPESTWVRLILYDVMGREVARLVDGHVDAGTHAASVNADGLASGTYIVRLSAGQGFTQTSRITVLR